MNSERIRSRYALAAVALLVAACSSSGGGTAAPAASAAAPPTAAASTAAGSPAASSGGGGSAEGAYIPIVSKGFQHQFWQAVKQGAEQEAKDLASTVNFEGPETEAQVDKQIEMLQAELDKNPAALVLRGARQQGGDAAAGAVQGEEHPGHRVRLGRRQRHPGHDGGDGQLKAAAARPPTTWPS